MKSSRWRYVGKKADPFYLGKPWRMIRTTVLQRDHYRCQTCKRRWANTVHHIIPRLERPDLALDVSNLVAICESCHSQLHAEAPREAETAGAAPEGVRVIKA